MRRARQHGVDLRQAIEVLIDERLISQRAVALQHPMQLPSREGWVYLR